MRAAPRDACSPPANTHGHLTPRRNETTQLVDIAQCTTVGELPDGCGQGKGASMARRVPWEDGWAGAAEPHLESMGQHNKRNGGRCRNQMMQWNQKRRLNISSTQVASGVALLSLHNDEPSRHLGGRGHLSLRWAGRQEVRHVKEIRMLMLIMAACCPSWLQRRTGSWVLVGKVQCNPPATGPQKNARRRQCHPANPSIPQQVNTHLLQAAAHRPLHHRSSHHGRLRLRLAGKSSACFA